LFRKERKLWPYPVSRRTKDCTTEPPFPRGERDGKSCGKREIEGERGREGEREGYEWREK